ncbi:TPA: head completion/stabilization protein [Pseudomonas putida]|nr:head completion/stabilization protein [Pseudomonas putida]
MNHLLPLDFEPAVIKSRFPDCHDPFWPRLDLAVLRERLHLRREISEAQLEVAARCAAIDAAREFARWRAALRERGYKRLEEVSGHDHGRALLVCYTRFVEGAVLRSVTRRQALCRGGADA